MERTSVYYLSARCYNKDLYAIFIYIVLGFIYMYVYDESLI